MRLTKWLLIFCLLGGLYYGWNQSGERIPVPTVWEQLKTTVSFRAHVESKLNRKNYVNLNQVTLSFQQALIAVEDNRFYHHSGIDFEAVLRATLVNLQSGELVEGGSTITQQLVKNLFLSQDRTWSRKALEIPLTFLMEYQFSKSEILEMYINSIYFGSGAYGVSAAAQTYFRKSAHALNLPESSLIAGLPAAPSLYSPLEDFDMAKKRQKTVLSAMVKHGYITPQQSEEATKAPLKLAR
jgi:penicillin-binding protein 1A